MDAILETRNLRKSYSGITVLKDVNFQLYPGEVHALLGENGAGKSTFIKALAGVIEPDSQSEIYFQGQRINKMTVVRARQLGLSVIFQDISLFPNLSVAENISSGIKLHGWQNWRECERRAADILSEMGVELDIHRKLGEISIGQQQLVAIARALSFQCKVLIMDEPTASLSSSEVEILYRSIEKMKSAGIGIIYISHKFEEIFHVADRVSVLRDGSLVAGGKTENFTQDSLINLMVGRKLHFIPYHSKKAAGEVLFEVEHLTCQPFFRDISFKVRKYEILGITGLVGAGRSELAQTIFGIHRADSGRIRLMDQEISVRSVKEAIDLGICYLPEDRREQGLFMENSVMVNTTAAKIAKSLNRWKMISRRREIQITQSYIDSLTIKPDAPEVQVSNMSGGNQQKILVARWLHAEPKVLIVDEVTSGVDVGVKSEIHRLIRELADHGIAVVVISSDLPEILALTDRIMIMRKGETVGFMNVSEATQEVILEKGLLG